MKLAKKKGLHLNVQNTLPRSDYANNMSQLFISQNISNSYIPTYSTSNSHAPNINLKDQMAMVCQGIFLGNYMSAIDKASLVKENITHIVNCSPIDCPNMFEKDIIYLNINIKDNWKTNLFLVIYIILDFLRDALQQNGSVLIHCNQGISRSPSIIIAYLIYTEKINPQRALDRVKEKYPFADPNLDFQLQLNEMYKEVMEEENQRSRKKSILSQQQDGFQNFTRLLNEQCQHTDRQNKINDHFDHINQAQNNLKNDSSLDKSHISSILSVSPSSSSFENMLSMTDNDSFLISRRKESQSLGDSTQITISMPDLPWQKLNYDSYKQRQNSQYQLSRSCNQQINNLAQIQSKQPSSRSLFIQTSPFQTESQIKTNFKHVQSSESLSPLANKQTDTSFKGEQIQQQTNVLTQNSSFCFE